MGRTVIVTALALLALGVVGAAGSTPPSVNLLQDPGAEAAVPKGEGEQVVPIPGWQTESGLTALAYGVTGTASVSDASAWGGGSTFFYGGQQAVSKARQTISVAAYAAEIDAGTVPVTLSAALGGYAGQNDNGKVTATFLSAAKAPLGSLTIGPVLAKDRSGATKLVLRSGSKPVPAGTRSIEVLLTATRTEGSYNDASFDNISLTLTGATASASAVGLWRVGNLDYRWVTYSSGYEVRSMTPHRLPNKCLIATGEAVHRYFAYGTGLHRVQHRMWGPKPDGPGTNGLNCRSYWDPAQKPVRIVATATTLTVSCESNVTRVCTTYRRIGS